MSEIFFIYLFFTFKARQKVTEVINDAVVHYRDDVDLQNLIDFGQEEVGVLSKLCLNSCSRGRTGLVPYFGQMGCLFRQNQLALDFRCYFKMIRRKERLVRER